MSRMAFLTRVLAFSHVVPPSLSSDGRERAAVLLNEIEPLDRDEKLVLARVAELHELLRRLADVDALEADEHADAVIDVDDQVIDFQIAEVGKEGACRGASALVSLALFLEDIRLGPELERRLGQAEPAREVADADEHGGGPHFFGPFNGRRVDLVVGEELDGPFGPAVGVGDQHHRLARLTASTNLGNPVGDAARELERRLTGDVHGLFERKRFQRSRARRAMVRRRPR